MSNFDNPRNGNARSGDRALRNNALKVVALNPRGRIAETKRVGKPLFALGGSHE
jgi:hypothetical protein